MFSADPFSANAHLVPLGVVTSKRLKEYIKRWKAHWTKAICLPSHTSQLLAARWH
ncbi:hypothetical protein BGW80DRAFT_1307377 [Lactifluus volemus]|nr:hypothetical protein BGW80DRAFT_1307377 [Lactifluus volemus]